MVAIQRSRWPPCPYMVKIVYQFSTPEPRKHLCCILACSIRDVRTAKFAKTGVFSLPSIFLNLGQFAFLYIDMGNMLKSHLKPND